MRISNDLSCNQINSISYDKKVQLQSADGTVTKKQESAQIVPDYQEQRKQSEYIPEDEVIDYAINKDLKKDKSLIGKDANLETLDVKKAISDMKKDSILREYQVFVQDPITEDGSFRKIVKK